jgi:UDPglucose--hexose-1-phosphate uridylyltransferase
MEFRKEQLNGVEYRFDPLTDHQTRINPARAKRLIHTASDTGNIKEWADKTREKCPFCPERVIEATPCFPSGLCKEGRIKSGETFIFPNLNPFSQHHAVATLSPQHFLDVDQFDEALLAQNLTLSRDYFLAVYRYDHNARYPIYIWNYLPPSAGSIIHPHVQLMVERTPIPEQKKLFEKGKAYFEKEGNNYWDDLIEEERAHTERYIASVNNIHIMASYAPRGFREVTIIVQGVSSFTALDEHQIATLAGSLSKVLKGYKSMGVGSFNMVSYSAGIDENFPHHTLHFKIVSRPYPRGVYTNDSGPFERFYDVWVIDTLPEEVAHTLSKMF